MLARTLMLLLILLLTGAVSYSQDKDKPAGGLVVDKEKRTITIPCKIAPRQLPNLKSVYPLEVVATWPAPKGQKAHETVVTFDVKPSDVHKALEGLGLKAGKPGLGENSVASGPEVKILLQIGDGDNAKRVPIEETMLDKKADQPFPKVKWLFTGSAVKYPDPEKDDKAYGADLTGTMITIFPVTDDTVFQSNLGKKDEGKWRFDTNKKLLPDVGTPVKLIVQAQ